MNRTQTTIVTLLALVISRTFDIASTLHFNPSLSHEANFLGKWFGIHFGVGGFVLGNLVVLVPVLILPLWFYWRYPAAVAEQIPKNVGEFASLQLFNRILPRGEFLRFCFLGTPFPRNWIQLIRCLGFTLSWIVVFGSILAGFGWWTVYAWHWGAYQHWRFFITNKYPISDLLLCIPVAYLIAIFFYRREFSESQAQSSGNQDI